MPHSIMCFELFNWRQPTHWLIAAFQLLRRERYWWVVHCAPLIQTNYGMSTIEVRFSRSRLDQYQPDHYRELYYPQYQADAQRIAYLLAGSYHLNCADLALRMSNLTLNRLPTPAAIYGIALSYTAYRNGIAVRDPELTVTVPTANNTRCNC